MKRIYLDCNASMPLRPEVSRYVGAIPGLLGNPASIHEEGRRARAVIDEARASLAAWSHVDPGDVIFTSGGTEANAMAIQMLSRRIEEEGKPLRAAVNVGSHASIRENAASLQRWEIKWYGNKQFPRPAGDASIVLEIGANNETGAVTSLASVVESVRRSGALLHVDAVQCPGKLAFDPNLLSAASFSLSGHKIGAPMGAGALIMPRSECGINGRESREWRPLFRGGGQESGRRSGTPPLSAIAGFGAAIPLPFDCDHCRQLAVRMWERLAASLGDQVSELSDCRSGLPGTLLVSFSGAPGDVLNAALDTAGIAASYGSACSSGEQKPSEALIGLGFAPEIVRTAVRFSIAPFITIEEIDDASARICGVYRKVVDAVGL